MAITIQSSPSLYSPVYNPIYFNITSSNVAKPNFKFVFNLYEGSGTTGSTISTIKLSPRPDNSCIYNPAKILESLISYDNNIQNITSSTATINNLEEYTIDFGEEYGLLTTGTTEYTGLTDSTNYAFNGVLQYTQIPSWDYTKYWGGIGYKFLTNQPREGVYVKNLTDRGTLIYANNSGVTAADSITYKIYNTSGGSSTYIISNAVHNNLFHIPSGIWNINQALGSVINLTTTSYYTIQVSNIHLTNVSEVITYIIDDRCSKYQTIRLQFLNRLGGYDYFNFDMLSKKTVNISSRDTYKKSLSWNYAIGDRMDTVMGIEGNYVYTLNTNLITDAESVWMEELLTSTNVNIINSDGTSTPVLINENTIDIQTLLNNGTNQYTFTVTTSFGINSQRA